MENHPISEEELGKVKKAQVCETHSPYKIIISVVVVKNLLSFRFLLQLLCSFRILQTNKVTKL